MQEEDPTIRVDDQQVKFNVFNTLKCPDELEAFQFVEDIECENWISTDAELDDLVTSVKEQENKEENVNMITNLDQIFEHLDLNN